ncbi:MULTISPECIES: amidohydrolase family protein [unclassified Pseudonocardia]|uniref:amidohydrolase family protein n=1 Tax=unclassified Pseudonocardia TaxID=2619320 RepID=UPI000AAEDA0B|nr:MULTISPECIES: amidohydrolase family protein [unclassified Pseudonocardia]MBN9102702.1 amidohydrolase family protein [Pseudonocardia sp.]
MSADGNALADPAGERRLDALLDRHAARGPAVATSQQILVKGGSVLSMDSGVGDFAVGDVLIVGDRIAEVGAAISAPKAVVIDARDHIVMPGFCDPHIHCWEGSLGRIIPENIPQTTEDAIGGAPVSGRSYMYAAHRAFAPACRPEDIYAGTLITLLAALNGGITTVVDNMHNARSPEHSDAGVEALFESGVRGVHAVGGPRAGTWAETFPADAGRLRDRYFRGSDDLCSMRLFAAGSDDLTELLPVRKELDLWFSFDSGIEKQDLAALYKDGSFDGREAINHANFLSSEQRQIVVDNGAQVNVCPRIEAQFRYGRIPYNEWVEQGLRPGLSNDNPMTYAIDMFAEMRALYLTQRVDQHRSGSASATLREILQSATQQGANNCGVGDVAGSLTPGKKADLILVDTSAPHLFPRNNVLASVVQGAGVESVTAVLVNGRVVKWDGRLIGVDLDRARRLVQESHDHLIDAVNWPHAPVDFDD